MNQLQYVDLEGFLERLGGLEDLGAELAAMAAEAAPGLYLDLEQSLEQNDVEAAHRHAHSLKGLIEGVGGQVCAASAAQIMRLAKDEKLSAARERLPGLKEDLEATLISLRHHFPTA